MRKGLVYYKNQFAGTISENENGYIFKYDQEYLNNLESKPISLTLPKQQDSYESKILFPFFDGLIPEGWLLNIAVKNWKLNSKDRFGLLLTLCKDCIGAVSIVSNNEEL
ncbi:MULTISPECIES: HipA N-terminal domain-containing protein [Empedobacter]|uniref:HipA N-terminal domain-containing protein n=1 Tax=Empedobacter TaxID=59734 RepID=UPI002575AC32|nr:MULTISPECIES: HipA N-terminal domain-containing protein [Empedobacter]MDM1043192.1 HipA N-terminal domain-containing protein [Empedobacter brevis]MDM1137119.1 HipA N-terminal domain-containing protein [Empedobacter sp. R750]